MCAGNETSLFDCPHNGVGIENCGHSEDAGAICEGGSSKEDNKFTFDLLT